MFHHYVQKAEKALSVLALLSNFMSLTPRQGLMKTVTESQFGHCTLVRLFHGRTVNRKINHLRERFLRILY